MSTENVLERVVTETEDDNSITFSGLDPVLGDLGTLIGLLNPQSGSTYSINNDWFSNPFTATADGVKNHPDQIVSLLGQILGEVAGQALGIPVTDPSLLGTWYPILNPSTGKPTGFYFVAYPSGANQVFGLGVLHQWEVPTTDPLIQVNAWGLVPVLMIGSGEIRPVLNTKGFPITAGVSVSGSGPGPLVDVAGFQFDGVRVSAGLDLADSENPVQVTLTILQLKLVGDEKPSDRSLADLAAIGGQEIINTAAALFVAALGNLSQVAADRASFLLPAIGLSSIVPGIATQLPPLRWDQLFANAANPSALVGIFTDWFRQITADPELTKAWMTSVAGFIGITDISVTGSGTRQDPYLIPILDLSESGIGVLFFSAATTVEQQGVRFFYPGLNFVAQPIALGTSDVVLSIKAGLEMSQFAISGAGGISPPNSLNFDVFFTLENKTAGQPLVASSGYSFGNLQGGAALGLGAGGPTLQPLFQLNSVQTPQGNYDSIDLLSPGELAKFAEDQLPALIETAFKKLLGIDTGEQAFASNVAAMVGLINPNLPNGVTWPADLEAPFTAKRMADTYMNPLGALADYYRTVLTSSEQIDNKSAFAWIVQELADLLAAVGGSFTVEVTGDGTPQSPWTATIALENQTLPAALTAYQVPGEDGATELVLGLAVTPELEIGGVAIHPSANFDFLSMTIPPSGTDFLAQWAPSLAAAVTLPDGFTTPEFAGVRIQVEQVDMSAGWNRSSGWHWSLVANKPVLFIGDDKIDINQDLNFSDQDDLKKLVTEQAFIPLLEGILGTALLRFEVRAGTAITGLFGLLPNLQKAPVYPEGLAWPSNMPRLNVSDLSDPVPDIRNQFANVLASKETAVPALTLLAWATLSSGNDVPDIGGDGSFATPYSVPLGTTGFDGLIWYDGEDDAKPVGLGLSRDQDFTFGDIKVNVAARVNAVEVSLATGSIQAGPETPTFTLIATVSNSEGNLATLPGDAGSLGSLALGMEITFVEKQLGFAPIVNLIDVTLPGMPRTKVIGLDEFEQLQGHLMQAFMNLVYSGFRALAEAAKDNQGFQEAYNILEQMGLTLSIDGADVPGVSDGFGISSSGWLGILSDPKGFITAKLEQLLTDADFRNQLFSLLQSTLGVEIPDAPVQVKMVLEALGFAGPADEGYPLLPEALLELFQRPFATLSERFQALAGDTAAVTALAGQLTGNIGPLDFGNFTFSANSGTTLELATKEPFVIASVVEFSGNVQIRLDDLTLTASLSLFLPSVGLSLVPQLTVTAQGNFGLEIQLVWGDGSKPAGAPITIFPFKSEDFQKQLADVAPAYVLNIIVNAVVELQLLDFELVQKIFAGLGIAKDENGVWQMPSILGLLDDPLGWLLSEDVFGTADGKFNLGVFGTLLGSLPAVQSSNGIAVTPGTNSAKITGLPYKFEVDLSATTEKALIMVSTSDLPIATDKGTLNKLSASVTLDADYQPGIVGNIKLTSGPGLTSTPYTVTAGFDKSFNLAIVQTGTNPLSIEILPFVGWGSLLEQALRALVPEVVTQLTTQLLDSLAEKYKDDQNVVDFINALKQAGTNLDIPDLISKIAAADPFDAEHIEEQALLWLKERFSEANRTNTAKAVVDLFQPIKALEGKITQEDGLVSYKPSADLPLTILLGVDDQDNIGLWADLNLPATSFLKTNIQRTGFGLPLAGGDPIFTFGMVLTVPIDETVGPQIGLVWDPTDGFVLGFDPLGDSADTTKHSALFRELLPRFFPKQDGDPDSLSNRLTAWIFDVLKDVLPRYISSVLLNTGPVREWLDAPIVDQPGAPTPGLLLTASSILITRESGSETRYFLNTLEALKELTPEAFLGNFLRTLMKVQIKLLSFGPGNKSEIWIGPNPNDANSFGVRLVAPDLTTEKLPFLVLQIGADDKEWIEKSGGSIGDLEPGISIYVPIPEGATISPQFQNLQLNLVNLGFDIKGEGAKPLVDMSRFKLGAVKPRTLLQLQMNDWSPTVKFGIGTTLADMALSLAPDTLAGGSAGNPVAKNVLGSGSADSSDNPPVDPTFSAQAAYTEELWINLSSSTGSGSEIVVPVQRSFGPLYVGSVGLGWVQDEKVLDLIFGGSISLAGLEAGLDRLTVGIPVEHMSDLSKYSIDLQGLFLQFQGGSVSVSGSFFKQDNPLEYTGAALFKISRFSVIGLGSYAEVPDEGGGTTPSLFVFAALTAPLGGVPSFFINGIAAGFSYNRNLILPDVGEVQNFPLVSGVINGTFTEGMSPQDALKELSSVVQPEIGQLWLAAGLKFKTYELLETFALMFIQFGRRFEIDLIGLTNASLPPELPKNKALAYVELAFKAVISPQVGFVSMEAQLTPNSFVLTQECKLTGGFAFFLWFKNISQPEPIPAGQFVVTLGGYHPAFQAPSFYPAVPRLGFSWLLDESVGQVSITGGAYFALVPTAIMAGGYLKILFSAGPLRAWLDAYANFLIEWKPFYFEVGIGVMVGVAFQTKIAGVSVTLKAELGAELMLAGPPIHGQVRVNWYIISFTIPFGSGQTDTDQNNLDWSGFEEAFLPPVDPNSVDDALMVIDDDPVYPRKGQQTVKLEAAVGLLEDPGGEEPWLIQPVPFNLRVDTAIPTQQLTVAASGNPFSGPAVGVRPMGLTSDLNVPLTVSILDSSNQPVDLASREIALDPVKNGAAMALWSKDGLNRDHAPDGETMILENALVGIALVADHFIRVGGIGPFPIENLKYDRGDLRNLPFSNTPAFPPAPRYTKADQRIAFEMIQNSIMAPDIVTSRNAVFAALRASAITAPADPSLTVMASSAFLVLRAHPVLARLGIYQNNGQPETGAVKTFAVAEGVSSRETAPLKDPTVLGIRRLYRVDGPPLGLNSLRESDTGIPAVSGSIYGKWVDRNSPQGIRILRGLRGSGLTARAGLLDGTLVAWKLDSRGAHQVSGDGNLPVLITSFDSYGEILNHRVKKIRQKFALPENTGLVTLQGSRPPRRNQAVGWRGDSEVVKINQTYAYGDGYCVRTQNFNRIKQRGKLVPRGDLLMAQLQADNHVLIRGGALKAGWVETIFLSGWPTVVVLTHREQVKVSMAPGNASRQDVQPVTGFSVGDALALVYVAPDGGDSFWRVLVQPEGQCEEVQGVFILPVHPEDAESFWHQSSLKRGARDIDVEQPPSTKVRVSCQ